MKGGRGMDSRIETTERAMRRGRQMRIPMGNGTNATAGTYRGRGLGAMVLGLQERVMRAEEKPHTDEHGQETRTDTDRPAEYRYYVPFRGFYGGWLVYALGGKLFRQYLAGNIARTLGVARTEAI
jgi:hypothetical protein